MFGESADSLSLSKATTRCLSLPKAETVFNIDLIDLWSNQNNLTLSPHDIPEAILPGNFHFFGLKYLL